MSENSRNNDDTENRMQADATGGFFSVGMPLHAVRAGYVRRRADEQLYEALRAGRNAHVVAPDRSGKSSLIAAIAARLESNGCKVAILDLNQLGDRDRNTDSGRWYYSVAYRLLRQLRIRYDLQSWWQDKSILSNRQRLFEFYSEILLQHISEPIVIFVDEIQCIEELDYADQLLTSIRTAHNARTTDPNFSRLSFVLLGECDPVSLLKEAEQSPFIVTQQISLDDFSREDLGLFATELNLSIDDANTALDRIYYWTSGQPYLTQKLARAVARESLEGDIEEGVDRIATTQLAGRAALHSEPHMSHIHRAIVNDSRRCEALLNLYGKIRKGIEVAADLGSSLQRRLMAVGLLVIDEDSNLRVRNRLYEAVFTARWANENLPTRLKIPAIVAGVVLLIAMIPFWYTQWLPNPYLRTLASDSVDLSVAISAYENFRSFPGHADTADALYRQFLERRALLSTRESEIEQLATLVAKLPNSGALAEEFVAGFWDRKSRLAVKAEDRDTALLASIRSLELATSLRRQRAASLVGDDYGYLLRTMPAVSTESAIFDPVGMILTVANGAEISQHSYTPQGVQRRETWSVTALEIAPLVRRVIVDREGLVDRIGLTLNISHARLSDLRIKIISPSGRAVDIETGMERAANNDDIRIPAEQLTEFRGESLSGTWSISVRDESLGVAGQLVGWNLKLNSQGAVEYFQRGLNIPDPVERETDDIWFDPSGRYAVARAEQSDSARIWDLAFAEPARAVALPASEVLIGLDAAARRLVTATQDTVNLWDIATGDRAATFQVGAASGKARLTQDRTHLFVERRSDVESHLELWSLETGTVSSEIAVAGVPALIAIDAAGSRVALADFDQAVRVWDFQSGELLGQFDLPAQPDTIRLSADGSTLGVIYPDAGLSLWNVADPLRPLLDEFGTGMWQVAFSPSGNLVAAGRPETGYQIYSTKDGTLIGPPLGVRRSGQAQDLLAFSDDEQVLLTGSPDRFPRFWTVPRPSFTPEGASQAGTHRVWSLAAERGLAVAPDGRFVAIGDTVGHVHIVPTGSTLADVASLSEDISFVGHIDPVRLLNVSRSGSLVASIATDNSLRVWKSSDGEPLPFVTEIPGAPVTEMTFSADAGYVALLGGNRASLVDTSDGHIITEFESATEFSALSFAGNEQLYFGSRDGTLHMASRAGDGTWQLQRIWQGPQGIRLLRVSPRGDFLVLVDQANRASQFMLATGIMGEATLQLPSDVKEIAFDKNGSRAYFRTSRWVHRASSSISGLIWMDALFVPKIIGGARLVYGNGSVESEPGHQMYIPVAKDGFVDLVELGHRASGTAGLFGNKDELLEAWSDRINAGFREEF